MDLVELEFEIGKVLERLPLYRAGPDLEEFKEQEEARTVLTDAVGLVFHALDEHIRCRVLLINPYITPHSGDSGHVRSANTFFAPTACQAKHQTAVTSLFDDINKQTDPKGARAAETVKTGLSDWLSQEDQDGLQGHQLLIQQDEGGRLMRKGLCSEIAEQALPEELQWYKAHLFSDTESCNFSEYPLYIHIPHPHYRWLRRSRTFKASGAYLQTSDWSREVARALCLPVRLLLLELSHLLLLRTLEGFPTWGEKEELIGAGRAFHSFMGKVDELKAAFGRVASLVDSMGIDTSALREAENHASEHFRLERAEHRVADRLKYPVERNLSDMTRLATHLSELADGRGDTAAPVAAASSLLHEWVTDLREKAAENGNAADIAGILRTAKALYRRSVTVGVLCRSKQYDPTCVQLDRVSAARTIGPVMESGDPKKQEQQKTWIAQALVTLMGTRFPWKLCVENNGGNWWLRLSLTRKRVTQDSDDVAELKQLIKDNDLRVELTALFSHSIAWLTQTRVANAVGGDSSLALARVLRGFVGSNEWPDIAARLRPPELADNCIHLWVPFGEKEEQ